MLEKYFCGSPWIHMRIEHNGDYRFCRWGSNSLDEKYNIKNTSPIDYFQKHMSSIRSKLLAGEKIKECSSCHVMELHGKISGRQKQLLKIGVMEKNFSKSLLSSPILDAIKSSYENQGVTGLLPVDWQIDLGNYCNSACVMCDPRHSSRLAKEWQELGFIEKYDSWNWTQQEELIEKFIDCLTKIKNLQYLHFLGGETLIVPAFKKLLEALVNAKISDNVVIGFTTNLTVWPEDVIDLLKKFKNVHVGLSIETLNTVNDYIRWPSKIDKVKATLKKFVDMSEKKEWFTSLRITPSLFTVMYLDDIYRFALENNVGVESCNFLNEPSYLKIDMLPLELRKVAITKLSNVSEKIVKKSEKPVINIRRKDTVVETIKTDIESVISYLNNVPVDTSQYNNLITFLKTLEKKRNNKITDHAKEYGKFLTSIGY